MNHFLSAKILSSCLALGLLVTACGAGSTPAPSVNASEASPTTSTNVMAKASASNGVSNKPAASTSSATAASPINAQQVKSEGKVVGYGVLVDSQWKALSAAMMKANGIPVENYRANTSKVVSRIETEEGAGKHLFDFVALESDYQDELAKKGYLQKLPPEILDRVPTKWRDPNGYWATFTLFPNTIIYNTNLVPKDQAPKSLDDLTDPKWKGKIAMTDPVLNEAFLRWFQMIREQRGAQADQFFAKLAANDPTFFPSGLTVSTNVNQGQFPIGIGFMTHVLSVGGKNGHMNYVNLDPMPAISGSFALAANPPHPEAAKALANVFLSNTFLQQSGDLGYPITVPGIHSAIPGADSLNYKLIPFLAGNKFQEAQDYFKKVFKK